MRLPLTLLIVALLLVGCTGIPAIVPEAPMLRGGMAAPLDIAGFQVQVTEVRLYDFEDATAPDAEFANWSAEPVFDGATVLGILSLAITNTADIDLRFYTPDAAVAIGSEQAELWDYVHFSDHMDDLLMPGVTKRGQLFFALHNTRLSDLNASTDLRLRVNVLDDKGYAAGSNESYVIALPLTP